MADAVKVKVDTKVPSTPLLQFKHADLNVKSANKQLLFTSRRNYGKSSSSNEPLEVRAHADAIDYVSMPSSRYTNYMVGVRKAGTNELQLIPATLLEMTPRLSTEANQARNPTLDTPEKRQQARAHLVESFGGKKQKRVLHSRTRYMLSDEALETVASTMADAVTPGSSSSSSSSADGDDGGDVEGGKGRMLPPNNLKSKDAAGVYPLDGLVLSNERAALKGMYPSFHKPKEEELTAWRGQNRFMPFVIDVLERDIMISAKGKQREARILALKYLAELLKFHNCAVVRRLPRKRSDLVKTLKSTPDAVIDGFINKFLIDTDDSSSSPKLFLSKQKQHLLLMYILTIALHACKYKNLPLDAFATELKTPLKEVENVARALGCIVKKSTTSVDFEDSEGNPSKRAKTNTLISLKLPLVFRTRRGRAK
ncbi:hypothetical protein PTSG_03877 [Salpingoeca rosetta]|uniref:DNA-directed RNA polymerase I subunit RPA49 n=1 Tax=Salpingoeca rosetta (strain ATCC 50818 / BSB-021) TaxID=946362 RepID=F2U5N0_SALR5|nr:uncharacterized protein PTSG_03877 [Salpingoeca rosetta]EGD83246.1 hypothetical protein PTSG_03877 [Salpingoeca rosetta]|eukprot:XP_004995610.1 hypothetical protein PTSG_03877 [Salpingoeca rosetta]